MTGWWWVCVGAAVGAPTRYLVDRAVQARHASAVPWGTFVVNVVGSLVLGLVMGLAHAPDGLPAGVVLAVGTGFCGALTTWSTLGYEGVRLLEEGRASTALRYLALSLAVGVGAATAGYGLAGLVLR